jgi:hypothetical protein
VRSLAGGISPLRDSALVRLWEFDPHAARAITLDRIRKADIAPGPYNDYRISGVSSAWITGTRILGLPSSGASSKGPTPRLSPISPSAQATL